MSDDSIRPTPRIEEPCSTRDQVAADGAGAGLGVESGGQGAQGAGEVVRERGHTPSREDLDQLTTARPPQRWRREKPAEGTETTNTRPGREPEAGSGRRSHLPENRTSWGNSVSD